MIAHWRIAHVYDERRRPKSPRCSWRRLARRVVFSRKLRGFCGQRSSAPRQRLAWWFCQPSPRRVPGRTYGRRNRATRCRGSCVEARISWPPQSYPRSRHRRKLQRPCGAFRSLRSRSSLPRSPAGTDTVRVREERIRYGYEKNGSKTWTGSTITTRGLARRADAVGAKLS
jgi:hypothetical protein